MSITDLKFEIDRESKTPLWLQIRNELFNCLYRDELRPGQLIPNEKTCLLYTSPSPRDRTRSRMPSSA